jgi:hypothetical protein
MAVVGMVLAGCASNAGNIKAAYVSPMSYQQYNCSQIGAEAERLSRRVSEVSGAQDQKATNDAVVTGVALVVFWPAAFMLSGDGPTAAELSRLKGEMEALEQVSIQKSCNIQFARQPAPPPVKPLRRDEIASG